MNRRVIFAWLAVWVFFFAYETVLHGVILGGSYRSLSGIFRAPEEALTLFPILAFGHLVMAAGLVGLLALFAKTESVQRAALFGLLLAVALGVGPALLQYVAMPLPASLVATWAVSGVVEFTAAAVLGRLVLGSSKVA